MAQQHTPSTTFGDLQVGDTFDWLDGNHPEWNSFYRRCVKISARKYATVDGEPEMTMRVGSIHATVFHVNTLREREDEYQAIISNAIANSYF